MRRVTLLCWFLGSLALGAQAQGCGDDMSEEESAGEVDVEALEAACEKWCDAQAAPMCSEYAPIADQCKVSCSGIELLLDGYCDAEYAASLQCAAETEYTCFMGYPSPSGASCVGAAQALYSCQQEKHCALYCKQAVAGGCGGVSESACVQECEAQREGFDDATCSFEYDRLLDCWGAGDLQCEGELPGASGCELEALGVGDCLGWDDPCYGYCWAAERFGCGGDACVSDCNAKLEDPTCGYEYRDIVSCTLRAWEATCGPNGLESPSDCEYDQQQYDECLLGM